jgi:hypothetical protein
MQPGVADDPSPRAAPHRPGPPIGPAGPAEEAGPVAVDDGGARGDNSRSPAGPAATPAADPEPRISRRHAHRAGAFRSLGRTLERVDASFALSVAVSRLVVGILISHVALTIFARGPQAVRPASWLSGFSTWDSGWYVGIANTWYPFRRSTVFFPGYPAAIRLVHMAFGNHGSLTTIALGIGWVAFVASVLVVQVLTRQLCSRNVARLAVLLYAWSPASVFLLAAYPESCFVLISAAALLCLRRNRLLAAALLAGLSTAFSPLGICVAVAVGISALTSRSIWRALTLSAVSIWGITAWIVWLNSRFHDPFVFMTEQSTFNRHTAPPFSGLVGALARLGVSRPPLGIAAGNFWDTKVLNLAFGLLAVAMFVYYVADLFLPRLRRFPPYFSVFAALSFLLPSLSVQTFSGVANPEALTRLTTDSVGLYPALALFLLRQRWALIPVLSLWLGLAVVFQLVFSLGFYFT